MTDQTGDGRRNGFALLAAIAALALIELVAIGLIALSMRARLSAEEFAAQTAARVAAESAIRTAAAHWDERAIGFAAPGTRFGVPWASGSTPGGVRFAVEAERLHRGVLLLRASAWSAAGPRGVRASAAATVTSIPSIEPRLDFHSALVAGGDFTLLDGGEVDASSPAIPPSPLQAADCIDPGPPPPVAPGSPRAGIALAAGATLVQAIGSTVSGSPPVLPNAVRSAPAAFASFGRVPLVGLPGVADHIATGTIALAPRTTGAACDTAAWGNWGAPSNRAHPCFGWLPFVFAPGSLTIVSGEGQGILVVNGDLTMADGVRFLGAVLVSGRFEAGDATIEGAVRVGAAGSRSAASIRFVECALSRALTLSPAMRKVYRHADRWWLPPW